MASVLKGVVGLFSFLVVYGPATSYSGALGPLLSAVYGILGVLASIGTEMWLRSRRKLFLSELAFAASAGCYIALVMLFIVLVAHILSLLAQEGTEARELLSYLGVVALMGLAYWLIGKLRPYRVRSIGSEANR